MKPTLSDLYKAVRDDMVLNWNRLKQNADLTVTAMRFPKTISVYDGAFFLDCSVTRGPVEVPVTATDVTHINDGDRVTYIEIVMPEKLKFAGNVIEALFQSISANRVRVLGGTKRQVGKVRVWTETTEESVTMYIFDRDPETSTELLLTVTAGGLLKGIGLDERKEVPDPDLKPNVSSWVL